MKDYMMVLGYSKFHLALLAVLCCVMLYGSMRCSPYTVTPIIIVPAGADFQACMAPFVEDMLQLKHMRCTSLSGDASLYVRLANVVIDQREVSCLANECR